MNYFSWRKNECRITMIKFLHYCIFAYRMTKEKLFIMLLFVFNSHPTFTFLTFIVRTFQLVCLQSFAYVFLIRLRIWKIQMRKIWEALNKWRGIFSASFDSLVGFPLQYDEIPSKTHNRYRTHNVKRRLSTISFLKHVMRILYFGAGSCSNFSNMRTYLFYPQYISRNYLRAH